MPCNEDICQHSEKRFNAIGDNREHNVEIVAIVADFLFGEHRNHHKEAANGKNHTPSWRNTKMNV